MNFKITHKRILSLLLIFLFLFSTASTSLAVSPYSNNNSINDIINRYSTNDVLYEVTNQHPLYSFANQAEYTLYELSPYGYAILLNETQSLMEACYAIGSTSPINISTDEVVYYGGPGIYCKYEDGQYYNYATNAYLSESESIAVANKEFNAKSIQLQAINILTTRAKPGLPTLPNYIEATVGRSYFANLSDYGHNANGTCTVIAAQMLLNYYDNYSNDAFISAQYEQGSGSSEAFHQLLNNYVYGTGEQGGIFIRNAKQGVTDYLIDQGLHYSLESIHTSQTSAINKIITTLRSGHPAIASMGTNCGADWDHSVLIYSVTYEESDPTSTAVFTMNMGWDTSDQQYREYVASASWFYECGYLVNNGYSHSMNSWTEYDNLFHARSCASCDYVEYARHSVNGNDVLNRCIVCGYSGITGITPQQICDTHIPE
ncbi:MAG: C39 family peptidase [Oscillospiraceae bacterium]|nr:C39 family peptidase [Oscillospiraceae bacterium]